MGMQVIMDLSRETLILSVLVEVVDDAGNKEDHNFLETLLVVQPLLGGESSHWQSNQSSQQSTMMRVSRENN